jgi:hypothetical protein
MYQLMKTMQVPIKTASVSSYLHQHCACISIWISSPWGSDSETPSRIPKLPCTFHELRSTCLNVKHILIQGLEEQTFFFGELEYTKNVSSLDIFDHLQL